MCKNDTKNERNSSIELLRIIAMLGVVVLHYNNADMGGGFKYVVEGSINQQFLYMTESIFIVAVNLFVMISAYFLCRTQERKIIKVVELLVQVSTFRVLFYLGGCIVGILSFTVKDLIIYLMPVNYFVVLYVALYIISPYINMLITILNKKQLEKLIFIMFVLFSVWSFGVDLFENLWGRSLVGLSTVGMYGSQYGYTIVNFVLIYFVGAYIRIHGIRIERRKVIFIISCLIIVLYATSNIERILGLSGRSSWYYNNPILIILACFIITLFSNFNVYNKVVNELAKSCFTCFLLHAYLIKYMAIKDAATAGLLYLIFHQIGCAVVLYIVSYFVYILYGFYNKWILKIASIFVK